MFKVFYSWQSDLDGKVNRGFIRTSIEKAQKKLQAKGIQIEIFESARGVPGSPDIANVILSRIKECDVLISDVSIINDAVEVKRLMPNPNVLLELGYGVGVLGWEKVVMVLNTAFGGRNGIPAVPKEVLPFDLGLKQVIPYCLKASDEEGKPEERERFASVLASQIETICLHLEQSSRYSPLMKMIFQTGAARFKHEGISNKEFIEQRFERGEEYLLECVQHRLFEFGESLGFKINEIVELLQEMHREKLVVSSKTNLNAKTWYPGERALLFAQHHSLFDESFTRV